MSRSPIDPALAKLLKESLQKPISDSERQEQIISLAYGNARIENDRITRSMVADAVKNRSRK